MTLKFVLFIMLGCLAFNMVGRVLVDWLPFPLYLDMWGTAIAAILLGPWRGAAVGAATNIVGVIGSTWVLLPFAIVNVAGHVWGYGVHRYGMGRTLPRFFSLNLLVAAVCSLFAVPIILLLFGVDLRDSNNAINQAFLDLGWPLVPSVGASNLLTSTADKFISGFVALVLITALPWRLRRGMPLVLADHRQ